VESHGRTYFKERADMLDAQRIPQWLGLDPQGLSARVLGLPRREDVDIPIDESLVVEYYSR